MGPTPPGTGVIYAALADAPSKSTSPTSRYPVKYFSHNSSSLHGSYLWLRPHKFLEEIKILL